MRTIRSVLLGSLVLCVGGATGQQAPKSAPAGATGICKDGTYSMAAAKSGACRGHKGVQTWYASAAAAAPAPTAAVGKTEAMPAPTPGASSPAAPVPTPAAKRLSPAQAAAAKTAAPGGGPGLVWLNTASNVYHCYGDAFYGKTKAGAYMSEADAKAKGGHGVRGQSCSSQ
jgi:hypothetical protein